MPETEDANKLLSEDRNAEDYAQANQHLFSQQKGNFIDGFFLLLLFFC